MHVKGQPRLVVRTGIKFSSKNSSNNPDKKGEGISERFLIQNAGGDKKICCPFGRTK